MLNKAINLIFILMLLTSNLSAEYDDDDEDTDLQEFFSHKVNVTINQYKPDEIPSNLDPKLNPIKYKGHFLTIIALENLPKNGVVNFVCKRPILADVKSFAKQMLPKVDVKGKERLKQLEFLIDEVRHKVVADGEGKLYMAVHGAGYMPGEEIECKFLSQDGWPYYKTVLIPQPIHTESLSKKIGVKAILVDSMGPAYYTISITGVPEGEELLFCSSSGQEKIKYPITYSSKNAILYSPGVIGKTGGLAKISYQTASKETIHFTLPWGDNLWDYIYGEIVYSPKGPVKTSSF